MRMLGKVKIAFLASALFFPVLAPAQVAVVRETQERIEQYRKWLDEVGAKGSRFWLRLDSSKRPHRLYIGEAFIQANPQVQEQFIEIFSRFLTGTTDKNMLIDIYDPSNGKWIGEYGFGGFRLF